MLVKLLRTFEYDASGQESFSKDVCRPLWSDVEAAICRLDKFRFPFFWLYFNEEANDDELPAFEVMGGSGDYVINSSIDGARSRKYLNPPSAAERPIPVWTSDQGCDAEPQSVCHDLDVVLRIARHFCEYGTLDPSVKWD